MEVLHQRTPCSQAHSLKSEREPWIEVVEQLSPRVVTGKYFVTS